VVHRVIPLPRCNGRFRSEADIQLRQVTEPDSVAQHADKIGSAAIDFGEAKLQYAAFSSLLTGDTPPQVRLEESHIAALAKLPDSRVA